MSDQDDKVLLQRLLARDETAFQELVDRHHRSLCRVAAVFVRSPSVAEEVAQEAWQGLLEALPKFEGRSSIKTFLFHILVNRARTRGVREARTVPFSAQEEPDTEPLAERFSSGGGWLAPPGQWESETPQGLMEKRETMACLARAIEELPPQQQAVVLMRDIEGLDAEEVCNILSVSETNQRVLLHRARTRLRAALESQFSS